MAYQTQDLIFTLYGDYIALRGGETWIGNIITLMSGLDISAQAVRSTLSRMTQKGWLRSRREGRHSFYAITPKTELLLTEGTQRIYQPRKDPWDGQWHILIYSIPEDRRHIRHHLKQKLVWLGFGHLGSSIWISPRDSRAEVTHLAKSLDISDQIDFFGGEYLGFSQNAELVNRCWDMERLNRAYLDFINHHRLTWQQLVNQPSLNEFSPHTAFIRRFLLVHEYRSFPYVDPNLPSELLPNEWLGDEADHLFQTYAALLEPQANQYVDGILNEIII